MYSFFRPMLTHFRCFPLPKKCTEKEKDLSGFPHGNTQKIEEKRFKRIIESPHIPGISRHYAFFYHNYTPL